MSNNEMLTDDFVADLLSKEASDCSLRYSAMGMEAFRDNKKPTNMPKPNTRFLRHIIKGTDSHNKALLAKEAAESRARLKDLEHAEDVKRKKTNPNTRDIRQRQMGDIHAILGGRKRHRKDDEQTSSSNRDTRHRQSTRKSAKEDDKETEDLFNTRRDERHHGRLDRSESSHNKNDERSHRSERSHRERKRRARSHSQDVSSEWEDGHRRSRSRRDRSRSRSPTHRRRSRSPRERSHKRRHRSPLEDVKDTRKPKPERKQNENDANSDSMDDDLIGPAPPPKYRGRGTVGGLSSIDRRFSETYDPKTDIQMDDDERIGDWDDAVEAFRDRQKLRQNQEQRLRAAGFADEQIQRASATDEATADNVQWAKAGEKRAWDKGKVIDADGVISADEL